MTDAPLPPNETALSSATEAVAPWPFDAPKGTDLGPVVITDDLRVPVVPPPATIEEARRRALDEIDAIWSGGGAAAEAAEEATDPMRAFAANLLDESLQEVVGRLTSEEFLAPFTVALEQGVEAANASGHPRDAVDRMREVFDHEMGESTSALAYGAMQSVWNRVTLDGGVPRFADRPADDEADRDETGEDA